MLEVSIRTTHPALTNAFPSWCDHHTTVVDLERD